jgi:YVTN family beta-propeller protein
MIMAAGVILVAPASGGEIPNSAHSPFSLAYPQEGAAGKEAPSVTETVTCCTWVTNISGFQTPQQMLYDPTDGQIWVSNGNYNGQNVMGNESVISDTTNTVTATISVQIGPVGIAYDSKKSEMYVVNEGGSNLANLQGSVSVISTTTDKVVGTFNNSVGINPEGVLYDSAKGEIFVANSIDSTGSGPSNISIYADSNNSVVGGAVVGINPIDMAYDSSKGEIFVANSGSICTCASSNISVISDKTNKVVTSITVGSGPFGLVYDSGKGEIFVGNYNDNDVSVINDTTDKVVSTIPVGYGPESLAYDAANGFVFVANNGGNNFTTINDSTNGVISNIDTGDISPTAIVYDSAKSEVFLANAGDGVVNVLKITSGTSSALTGVTVSPSSASVMPDGTATLIADPSCSNSCTGTTFSWSVTNGALGSLSTTTGSSVTFTAKGTTGTDVVFVNASLNGVTKMSPAVDVTISTTVPTLQSVTISPSSYDLLYGMNTDFTATPDCSSSCPSGTMYAWSESSASLGTLSSSAGSTVEFTANSTAGIEDLTVVATLNSVTKTSTPAVITISSTAAALTSVALTQTTASVQVNGTTTFMATPTCSATCPSGIAYVWSLSNDLGTLNTTSGSAVAFTAGAATGSSSLTVSATLNGVSKVASATITITSSSSGSGGGSSSNGDTYLIIVVVVVVIVVAVVAVMLMRRKRVPSRQGPPPQQYQPQPGQPPQQYAPSPQYPPQPYPNQPYPSQPPPGPPSY